MMRLFKRKAKAEELPPAPARVSRGFMSTDWPDRADRLMMSNSRQSIAEQALLAQALQRSFQKSPLQALVPVDNQNNPIAGATTTAMDEAFPDLTQQKLLRTTGSFLPFQQMEWFANQGFLGYQTLAILAQNWLIDKACTMPAQDAVRNGWTLDFGDDELDEEKMSKVQRLDRKYRIKQHLREFVKMGRTFGIRHAIFNIDGVDQQLPLNLDGVTPGSYRGITQIDPYWISPILDTAAASNPASPDFYNPTWWLINGKRVHRSHMAIMHNGDEVPDILKPSYYYAGISIPQKIFERVYAAERVANEAPMLAMTKRLITYKMDLSQGVTDMAQLQAKIEDWMLLLNNFGVKVIGDNEEVSQYDTSLAAFDETVMTQFQLVSAAASVPVTKLLGTTPKGFNATGEYDEASYHEELESLQEHDLTPFLEKHYSILAKSESIGVQDGENITVLWKPTDSATAEELADTKLKNAQADQIWTTIGAVDGYDVRQRLINDPHSGYTGIDEIVPEGPGDRDHEAEVAEKMLDNSGPASVPKGSKEAKAKQGGKND